MKTVKKLSLFQCLAYASPALALSLMAMTFFVYGPKFYSDFVKVDLALIGAVVFISRVWDAITDPLFGYLSDRTQTRWGRRIPWMVASCIPLAAFFILVFNPAYAFGTFQDSTWFVFVTIVFFLFWTTFSIPYEALGAELSFDYDERNKIFGIREGFVVLGTVCSALFPLLLVGEGNVLEIFPKLSIAYAMRLVLALVISVSATKEKTWRAEQIPKGNVFGNVKEVLSNRAFRLLLASYAIGAFSGALPATLILYYVEYVLGASESAANMFLLEYFVVGLLFLPAWVKLAEKWGKKEAWVSSMLVNTLAFAGVFFLDKGDTTWYGILVAVSAIGYGATLALPSSMQADVIDYDEHAHGTRKEGQFVGLWAIAKKCASAVGAGIALWVLGTTGYVPGQEQNENTIFALKILYAGIPCVGNLLAIAIAWRYPITKEMHSEIRKELENRNDSSE